jgi:hypothetical protein
VGAASCYANQIGREITFNFSHLRGVCIVFIKCLSSTQTEGETTPREETAIGR